MRGIVTSGRMRLVAFYYDIAMSVVAMLVALFLRYGSLITLDPHSLVLGALVPFAAASAISFLTMRTYRTSWRHASTSDLTSIFYASVLAVLLYFPLSFITTRLNEIPRSSVVMAWILLLMLMGGSRITYRLFHERRLFFTR